MSLATLDIALDRNSGLPPGCRAREIDGDDYPEAPTLPDAPAPEDVMAVYADDGEDLFADAADLLAGATGAPGLVDEAHRAIGRMFEMMFLRAGLLPRR